MQASNSRRLPSVAVTIRQSAFPKSRCLTLHTSSCAGCIFFRLQQIASTALVYHKLNNTDVRPLDESQLWRNLLLTLRIPEAPQLMQLTRQICSVPAAKQQRFPAGMPNRPPAAQGLHPRNRGAKAVPEEQEERQALEVEYKSTTKLRQQNEEDAESDHAAQTTAMAKQRMAKPGIPLTPENVAIGIVYFTQGTDV